MLKDVVESQVTLLVRPCLSLTEKHRTINHMIIFNDLIVSFTSAAFQGFASAYLCFLVSASAKRNAEVIKFLGTLKNMSLRIKYIFVHFA